MLFKDTFKIWTQNLSASKPVFPFLVNSAIFIAKSAQTRKQTALKWWPTTQKYIKIIILIYSSISAILGQIGGNGPWSCLLLITTGPSIAEANSSAQAQSEVG